VLLAVFLQPPPQSLRVIYGVAVFVLQDETAALALVAIDFSALGRGVLIVRLGNFGVTVDPLEGGALRHTIEDFLESHAPTLGAFEGVVEFVAHAFCLAKSNIEGENAAVK
jgi:hypothetical protein